MLRRWVALGALVLTMVSGGATARAFDATPGTEVAKRLFDEGQELEKKRDYEGALAKFRESEQIKSTPSNRFHKGYCLEMLGRLAAAIDEYEVAERLAREQNKTESLATTRARLEPLRGRVPRVSIKVIGPKDAQVQLDGVAVAPALIAGEAFRVNPGEHAISARAAGYEPLNRNVTLAESDATTPVELRMTPLPAPPPPPITHGPEVHVDPPSEQPKGRSLGAPIATTAGALALAGLGVGMFVLGGNAESDGNQNCPSRRDCDDERTTVRMFDYLAAGAWVGAVGLTALSVVLWASPGGSRASAPSTRLVGRSSWLGLEGAF